MHLNKLCMGAFAHRSLNINLERVTFQHTAKPRGSAMFHLHINSYQNNTYCDKMYQFCKIHTCTKIISKLIYTELK